LPQLASDFRPSNAALNALFRAAWDHEHAETDFAAILDRSLCHVCAWEGADLIGFVNVAWDGGVHGFLLDTCVLPAFRRRGIARAMVEEARTLAKARGIVWLHVDFQPELEGFYRHCGFRHTQAGLINLLE
jgi:GNAT superfamily N-acetyltransferase